MEQDHRIEPLAREVAKAVHPWRWGLLLPTVQDDFRRIAAFILDRESKRVGPLVEAAGAVLTNSDFGRFERFLGRRGTYISAQLAALDSLSEALATFRALDAPPAPEPSLAEAVEAMLASSPQVVFCTEPKSCAPLDVDGVKLSLVRPAALDAVRAALAREREKVKP